MTCSPTITLRFVWSTVMVRSVAFGETQSTSDAAKTAELPHGGVGVLTSRWTEPGATCRFGVLHHHMVAMGEFEHRIVAHV